MRWIVQRASGLRQGTGRAIAVLWMSGCFASPCLADDVRVAVAANFTRAAKQIATAFEKATGHRAVLSFGSTGQLFTQIVRGAPFEVFLAADRERPARLVERSLARPDQVFTYAVGRLVLFSRDPALVRGPETLRSGVFSKVAIANPETAPYGVAAIEVLRALGVLGSVESRLVRGTNIAQTYQFVYAQSADLGFVALAQTIEADDSGSRWLVPASLHSPLRQDGVLLDEASDSEAARAFVEFLKQPSARAMIEHHGYELWKQGEP